MVKYNGNEKKIIIRRAEDVVKSQKRTVVHVDSSVISVPRDKVKLKSNGQMN